MDTSTTSVLSSSEAAGPEKEAQITNNNNE
jgi:hypothetical protein